MRIYNYVRPLWSNGAHVVHDAPEAVRDALHAHFGQGRINRVIQDEVRVACLPGTGLNVAWINLEVELATENTNFSYRRGRYLHVLASQESGLEKSVAHKLLVEVYGENLASGVAAGQAALQGLSHPQHAAQAQDLFAGRRCAAGSAREPKSPPPRCASAAPVPMPPAPTSWASPLSPASSPSRAPVRKRIGVLSRAPTRTPVGFDPADATPAVEASNMSDELSRAWLSGRPINEIARKEPRERT